MHVRPAGLEREGGPGISNFLLQKIYLGSDFTEANFPHSGWIIIMCMMMLLLDGHVFDFWLSVGSPINTDVCPRRRRVKTLSHMSICQNATFQLRYQNESCSECHHDVR